MRKLYNVGDRAETVVEKEVEESPLVLPYPDEGEDFNFYDEMLF